MKTSLLVLFTTMLATAAFAAPLPGNALAAAAGAAAALNHTLPLTGSSLTLTPLTQRLELTVTPAPQIVPAIPAAVAAPAPVRAVRAR
ncbi:MAG: hypothetical protein WCK55_11600 [Verrucomicrobiota bacterium]